MNRFKVNTVRYYERNRYWILLNICKLHVGALMAKRFYWWIFYYLSKLKNNLIPVDRSSKVYKGFSILLQYKYSRMYFSLILKNQNSYYSLLTDCSLPKDSFLCQTECCSDLHFQTNLRKWYRPPSSQNRKAWREQNQGHTKPGKKTKDKLHGQFVSNLTAQRLFVPHVGS